MYGDDSAFYDAALIQKLVESHKSSNASVTLVTINKDNPTGLGRIIRNAKGDVVEIVEEKNATPDQKEITEINTGLYCFDRLFLNESIANVTPNSVSGEYYLTDVVGYATSTNKRVNTLLWPNNSIWYGVNTPDDLKEAELRMKSKNTVK
jgi:bifunctional UDP-N-acetylglucosamine pyrophosphorylase/glucosamine-1-phosphate N-acetyltransferase